MLRILGLFICLFLLVGCGDGDKKLTDLIDEEVLEKTIDILEVVAEDKYFNKNKNLSPNAINSIVNIINDPSKDFINFVTEGAFYDYEYMTVGEVFDNFFDNPRWEYFLADTNEHVVEFRGICLYEEVEVEALIQFIVTEEEFYTDYLSFNQVPQNMLMLDALIATVFQLEINQPIIDYSYKETRKEDFWYGEIDIWPGYLIGELFPDGFYTDLQWHTYDNIIYISGYYPGEIVPEEGSFVQMKLEFLQDNLYRVKNMYLNEKVIPSEDGWLIMLDLISFVK